MEEHATVKYSDDDFTTLSRCPAGGSWILRRTGDCSNENGRREWRRPSFSKRLSGDKRTQRRVLLNERRFLQPGIKAPDVASVTCEQVSHHGRVDDVIVDDEVVFVLDERPVHVRRPV